MRTSWGEAAGLRFLRIEPDAPSQDSPLIVAIHGRGADAADLAGLAREIGPEAYRWLLPQGPRPVPLGFGATGWAWYELGDDTTLIEGRERLLALLHDLPEDLPSAPERTAIIGFSQGAVMTLHVGLSSPESFAALVAMSGYLPAADSLISALATKKGQPILMVHGTQDPLITIDRARQARDFLREAGLMPAYLEFSMGHQITAESLAPVCEFLVQRLPPGGGP